MANTWHVDQLKIHNSINNIAAVICDCPKYLEINIPFCYEGS